VAGNLYWNSTVSEMRVYNGSAWVAAYLPAAGYMDLTTNQTAAGVKTFSSNPILSGGTANGVIYLNGSNALTSGSAMTFDGATLVTPAAVLKSTGDSLVISPQAAGSGALVVAANNANSAYAPLTLDGSYQAFKVSGSERGRFSAAGHFGLGTSSPYTTLDVGTQGASTVTSLFTTGVSDLNFRIGFANGVSGSTGSSQGKVGLFYLGTGEAATVEFIRGGGATDASMAFRTNSSERARIFATGGFAVGTATDPGAGLISDAAGNVRSIPPVGTKTGSYTLAKADVGKYVQVGSGGSITIPTSVFAEGDVVSLMNNTTGNVTITCSAPTAYKGGTNTVVTSLTLQTRGIATVFFISSSVCIVTGNLA
jgi:hypothetical protein